MVTNISYNVIIDRLRAFADGHYLIKKFSHGQIDLRYLEQDADYYPWMHVIPGSIRPSNGQREYSFDITFSDLTRDKEYESEYIREAISDCTRLAEDLLAEIKNGNTLFDSTVQSVDGSVITPFIHEDTHTLTGVTLSVSIRVPWDWSACDIPADYSPGGSGSGGGAEGGCCVTLQVEGVDNIEQSLLNLVAGSNMTITDNGDGSVTFDSTGGVGSGDLQQVTDLGNTTTNDIELIDAAVVMDNGSKLQKGTTDSGNGGLGGIALKCSIDYELKWDAGRLFVMAQDGFTIRETAHNFNNTPTTNDDDTKGYVVGSRWILDNGDVYECTDATSGAAVWVLQTLSAVTSVGLSVPSPANPAFSVSGSPVTTSGTFSIAANGTTLQYIDGTGALQTFPNIPTKLSDLIAGNAKGDLIEYNGTTWAIIPGMNLNKLTDVNLTTPTNGQVLQYNGTVWVNVTPSFSPTGAAGGDLSGNYPNPNVDRVHGVDMQSGTPSTDEVWVYGGSPAKWQHQHLGADQVNNTSSVTGTSVKDALDHLDSTKEPSITAGTTAQYWRGDKSWHTLDKSAVGLSNVDNTSDANKPISTATQTALNAKQDTLVSGTNIKTVNSTTLLGSGDLSVGTVTSVSGTGTIAGLSLSGTVTGSGSLTLGGTLSTPVSTINDSTTVGQNLVKLANPSAIRYLRINANNTVDAISATQLITDLGIINNIQLFKDFTVYSVVNTSTNTLFQTYAIAANSLQVNDFIEIFGHFNSNQTTGTLTYRLYINTANNLTGATLLATMSPTLNAGNVYELSRQIAVTAIGNSGNLRLPNVNTSLIAGGNLIATISNITVNTTVTQYLIFAAQMSVTTATTTQQMVFGRINR